MAWTQDTVGLLAPTVETAADAWRVLHPRGQARQVKRVGVDRDACATAHPDVAAAVFAALDALVEAGIEVVDVTAPDLRLAGSASVIAVVAEAAEAWASEFDNDPEGFGPRVRAALRAGREIPKDTYLDAKRVRGLICARTRELFDHHSLDSLALPTVPVTASPAGVERIEWGGRERSVEALQATFTALASLTGQPALSVPCGKDAHGLPVGLQLLGRVGEEESLLALASRLPTETLFV
jgi:Asp-tRNA(Asn)/Glu-tRNA(Gln) amidotransferase A subunit family amidase